MRKILTMVVATLAAIQGLEGHAQDPFAQFKKAIEQGLDSNARAIMLLSGIGNPKLQESMQRYAEDQCANKSKTGCSVAYCGAGIDEEYFFSKKCADLTGRAYGDGWMEVNRRREGAKELINIKCMNRRGSGLVWCAPSDKQCEHNQVHVEGSSIARMSDNFATLDAAARDACSGRVVRSK